MGYYPKSEAILKAGMAVTQEVPYRVSLRYVFYELLQRGHYSTKDDYPKWIALCAKARKDFHAGWHPDTLEDDTRDMIIRTGGAASTREVVASLADDLSYYVDFSLDHFYQQKNYVQLWFEARAMRRQFEHYTVGLDLVPFGGDPSIHLKWRVAQYIEQCARQYQKPVKIAYFGDLDRHGLEIPDSALNDIREWCNVDFDVVRCGLTAEQARRFNVPENPAKPSEFQWEALHHTAAGEIITESLAGLLDLSLIEACEQEKQQQEARWKTKVHEAIQSLVEGETAA